MAKPLSASRQRAKEAVNGGGNHPGERLAHRGGNVLHQPGFGERGRDGLLQASGGLAGGRREGDPHRLALLARLLEQNRQQPRHRIGLARARPTDDERQSVAECHFGGAALKVRLPIDLDGQEVVEEGGRPGEQGAVEGHGKGAQRSRHRAFVDPMALQIHPVVVEYERSCVEHSAGVPAIDHSHHRVGGGPQRREPGRRVGPCDRRRGDGFACVHIGRVHSLFAGNGGGKLTEHSAGVAMVGGPGGHRDGQTHEWIVDAGRPRHPGCKVNLGGAQHAGGYIGLE